MAKHLVVIILFGVLSAGALQGQSKQMTVHIINVGQGSAALVEFPCGVILVDTGGESNDDFQSTDHLMNFLETFFASRPDLHNTIDLLILSHPHIDHTRGVKEVAGKYRIKNLITNGEKVNGSGIAGQNFVQNMAAQSETTATHDDDINFFASINDKIPVTGITSATIDPVNCSGADPTITVLWGTSPSNPGWTAADFKNPNNHSVVCKIVFGQASVLLSGDLEESAIASLLAKYPDKQIFDSDVYLVGHHGSKNGSTQALIDAISPRIAVLSFGDTARHLMWTAWKYGHPNKTIVGMLETDVKEASPSREVTVGLKAETFTQTTIDKAIYGIGWGDAITLTADLDGTWHHGGVDVVQLKKVNINTSGIDDLQALPFVGKSRAKAIIKYRSLHLFKSVDELDNVTGIGPAIVNALKDLVTL